MYEVSVSTLGAGGIKTTAVIQVKTNNEHIAEEIVRRRFPKAEITSICEVLDIKELTFKERFQNAFNR